MSAPPELIRQAAEFAAGLPPEEREQAMQQFRTIVALRAPADKLEIPLPVRTLGEFLTVELPVPPALIDPPLVVRGELTFTVGKSGKGKTTMNLHRMMRWGAGLPMFDELPDILAPKDGNPLRVLLLENEGAAQMFQAKMQTMLDAEGYLPDELKHIVAEHVLIWGDGGYSNFKIDRDADFELLRASVEQYEPDVVFIEPFVSVHQADENSNSEIRDVLDRFLSIAAEFHVGVVIAHHERKGGVGEGGDFMDLARGASAVDGATAVMENFRSVRGGDLRELSYSKARYGGAPAPIRMEYDPLTYWYRYLADGSMEREILEVLVGVEGHPLSATDICAQLGEDHCQSGGLGYRRVNKTLNKLKREQRVRVRPNLHGSGQGWSIAGDEDTETKGLDF